MKMIPVEDQVYNMVKAEKEHRATFNDALKSILSQGGMVAPPQLEHREQVT